ncbi:MAG TPA: TlpA disulfide reductase family protein, partial [Bacillota bacterium]
MKARLAALAVLALFAVAAWRYAAGMQQVAAQGEPAPDFTLATLDDTMVSLSDFRGRPVLLNFWATWCPPCIEEAPALDALHRRYGDRLTILGIDHLEAAPAVAAFRNRFDLSYPLLLDRTGRVSERYSVRGLPETWMIDPGGTARIHRTGAVTFEEVQEFYRQVTGQSIDGDGVGPVPAGQQAFDLVVVDEALAVATDAGVMTAEPGADVGLADRAAWSADAGLAPPVYALARAGDGSLWAAGADGVWVRTPAAGGGLQPWRSAGLQGLPVMGLGLAPDRDRALAWVPGNGLYRLEGGAWTVVPTDLDPESIGSLALAADPAQPGRWLAGFAGGLLESR